MKKITLSVCAIALSLVVGAQSLVHLAPKNVGVKKLVQQNINKNPLIEVNNLFKENNLMSLKSQALPAQLLQEQVLSLNENVLADLHTNAYASLELVLPYNGKQLKLKLIKQDLFAPGFKISTDKVGNYPVTTGVHYRGVIEGDETSLAAISVFENDVAGLIATDEGNFNLGKIENPNGLKALNNQFIIYNDKNLAGEVSQDFCGTIDDVYNDKVIKSKPIEGYKSDQNCVNFYFEVDYSLHQSKGGVTGAANYMEAVFNQVAILYQNEQINTKISEIFVWSSNDPYGSNINTVLSSFRSNKNAQGFNGDIAHYVSLDVSGGLAYVDVICNSSYRYGVSQLHNSYQNVPTYSWTVEVVTHELGHNLGSPHTQSCSWPGGAIDNCYTTEGGCAKGPQPTNGGTIMSYCHLTSTGINFNNGFGPLPGNLIRDKVYNASCLSTCDVGEPVCSTPLNVTATNIQQTSLTVSWNAVSTANNYGFRYRQQGASSWINSTVSGTSKNLTGLSPLTSYEVQVRSNCDDNEVSDYSTSEVYTTLTDQLTYCSSKGNNVSYEYIAGVKVGTFTNNTGANGGYGDFSNLVININKDEPTSIQLTPGFVSSVYNETWTLFADLNSDGDFTDAGETLFVSGNVSTVVTGSITIPSSVANGTTRLRVSMKYNGASSSCETFTYGEVEDYTINIQDAVAQPCDAPTGLLAHSPTTSSISLSWNAVSNATTYILQSRPAGGSWSSQTVSGTSTTVTGLTDNTSYDFRIASDCGSETSSYSNTVSETTEEVAAPTCDAPTNVQSSAITETTFTVTWNAVTGANSYTAEVRLPGGTWNPYSAATNSINFTGASASTTYEVRVKADCGSLESNYSSTLTVTTEDEVVVTEYCTASGTNSSSDWIKSITIGNFTNNSGNNSGYGNYIPTTINLAPGVSTNVSLVPGFSGFIFVTRYPEYFRIWIDYNKDGDFDDAGELVIQSTSASQNTQNGSFTVPANATGTTRMRIAMQRNTGANSCGTFTRGEVEDYTVAFTGSSFSNTTTTANVSIGMTIAPNPTTGNANISLVLNPENGASTLSVFDVTGRLITTQEVAAVTAQAEQNVKVNLSNNAKGTYMIVLETASGEKIVKRLIKQ